MFFGDNMGEMCARVCAVRSHGGADDDEKEEEEDV